MTNIRFPEGNLIILYANSERTYREKDIQVPEHIYDRIISCVHVYRRILNSKPDRAQTEILVVTAQKNLGDGIKQILFAKESIDKSAVKIISNKSTLAAALESVLDKMKERKNPPTTYVVTSHWQREIYDNISIRFKELKVHFEGVLDRRPMLEIDGERDKEMPSKGFEFYKEKTKNKAVDFLLNRMFPDKEKGQ
jgi:hypothetical protein